MIPFTCRPMNRRRRRWKWRWAVAGISVRSVILQRIRFGFIRLRGLNMIWRFLLSSARTIRACFSLGRMRSAWVRIRFSGLWSWFVSLCRKLVSMPCIQGLTIYSERRTRSFCGLQRKVFRRCISGWRAGATQFLRRGRKGLLRCRLQKLCLG